MATMLTYLPVLISAVALAHSATVGIFDYKEPVVANELMATLVNERLHNFGNLGCEQYIVNPETDFVVDEAPSNCPNITWVVAQNMHNKKVTVDCKLLQHGGIFTLIGFAAIEACAQRRIKIRKLHIDGDLQIKSPGFLNVAQIVVDSMKPLSSPSLCKLKSPKYPFESLGSIAVICTDEMYPCMSARTRLFTKVHAYCLGEDTKYVFMINGRTPKGSTAITIEKYEEFASNRRKVEQGPTGNGSSSVGSEVTVNDDESVKCTAALIITGVIVVISIVTLVVILHHISVVRHARKWTIGPRSRGGRVTFNLKNDQNQLMASTSTVYDS